ncbi:Yhi9p KNAG_0M01460 [Huiozyma naganishii CBS 8797]|uniref:Phenazine biosynthesis protein n=1 Tax=Huiozyma naganishii (strain ATCC MYA-139 / BCRC 22969 / CBS 8797 / KCTC 17520 / NBRC 10181 / NCYC 3082 / Yp74L-3) TaxID=1071383 RepID=J7SAT1_HUIN7|nr:hypothetical protein KNAG_0M01460 [Kazachstania naganishii CBS 8797]CCK72999.1 hypothetical protein KNAG_0M01460 [Kazachstania naganishii CBS 8797]
MSRHLPFKQVDVFTTVPYKGNPVAVINCMGIDESEVTKEQLQSVANWTNLSETTFLFKPTDGKSDYKLRIFTPVSELPFAGHPTVGSCKAFLEFTNQSESQETRTFHQQCGVGSVELTVSPGKISFKAAQTAIEELDDAVVAQYEAALGISTVAKPKLLRVGPNWVVLLTDDAQACYNANPDFAKLAEIDASHGHSGVILGGAKGDGEHSYEMRAFAPSLNVKEDPVCGSGALSFIRYLQELNGYSEPTEISISQGGRLGRNGQISGLIKTKSGTTTTYHIGGDAVTAIEGQILL